MPLSSEQIRDHLSRVVDHVSVRSRNNDGGESEAIAKAPQQLLDDAAFHSRFVDLANSNLQAIQAANPLPARHAVAPQEQAVATANPAEAPAPGQ